MADEKDAKDSRAGKGLLGPKTSLMISFLFWSIVIVPISMGTFLMLEVIPRFTDLGNQYSVVLGLFFGLFVALIVGYIYSMRARKHSE